MIYRNIYNPSHATFADCLDYMLRTDLPQRVSYRISNFGRDGGRTRKGDRENPIDRDMACAIAQSLAALTEEYGTEARPVVRPFRHAILSLASDEDLTDREMHDLAAQVQADLVRKYKPAPVIATITAVHRDTDNLHAHILSIPVDLRTARRINMPETVQAYRKVLEPLERKHGLSSPPKIQGGWNFKRYYLPFKTWVRMGTDRLRETKKALLESKTWTQAMQGLANYGIKFAETSKDFAATTRYFLRPFGAGKTSQGMSIQRDVFADHPFKPTAAELVKGWGEFPREIQSDIERMSKPIERYREKPIGGERGELLHKRWLDYARKRNRRVADFDSGIFQRALDEAKEKHPDDRSRYDQYLLDNSATVRREIRDRLKPMEFSHWVEAMADHPKEKDARWLSKWGNMYAGLDPDLAQQCEDEGKLDPIDELELLRELKEKRDEEKRERERQIEMERETRREADAIHRTERIRKRDISLKELKEKYHFTPRYVEPQPLFER